SRTTRRLVWIGIPVVLLVLLIAFWNWDWFIPLVQSRASASIGRPVKIAHLHVRLGRVVQITADEVVIANPPDWPSGDPPLAAIRALTIQADAWGYIKGHGLVLPMIGIDGPKVLVAETADGAANFRLSTGGGGSGGSSVKIGDVRITDGDAHIEIPKLKADFDARIDTQGDDGSAKIVVDAKGKYAAQPITARLIGGALLSLRDADHPWPIDLTVANGPTHVALNGTIQDPLAFRGANLRLRFTGPDMALLEPLVGFPIPKTPAYQVAGKLDLQGFNKIRFEDFQGRLGNSDIAGSIEEQPEAAGAKGTAKPVVTMDLRSNRIDLTDLNGFIGGTPGRANSRNATPQERQAVAKADASRKLLPDTPISVPRLGWADIHLRYHGAHIEGRDIPLDNLTVALDVVGGRITLHPISFGVGKGRLIGNIDLTPTTGKDVHARVNLRMQNLDVSRMMAAMHTFQGAGSVSGVGAIDATGDSLASLMANGNGEVKMAMAGGDLSAVLVDLTGLQFGNALLSALGVPNKTEVQCFVSDLALQRGVLDFKAMTLDTGEAITNIGGDFNLAKETIDLSLKTDAKHFSVGSLPTRINIGGTFKDPSIRPGAEVAARAGAAAGLAALFLPLAILPTIQFGTSEAEDARCGELLRQARDSAGGKALPAPLPKASSAH
ncbi:MAG: AsmA family protein, partial [Pseudomonadota bacterium]|nr:AsmA family protein [Pseudomonadota bacterium]